MKYALIIGMLLAVGAGGYWLGTSTVPVAAPQVNAEHKILYYRNPMGLPDTSPVPKKDPMGMDYLPVFEGDRDQGGQLNISLDKVQKLGVKSEAAATRLLDKTIRASGRIEIDERRSYTISPKFEGWVEKLYVNTTGAPVSKGQPLFDVYSPELVSARREYELALQGMTTLGEADQDAKNSMKRLAEAARMRLKNWGIADAQIDVADTEKQGMLFRAPVSGIVLEKKAQQGMRFMPGEVLYQIADLSTLWVVAEVAEQDIASVRLGAIAQVKVDAYPDREFSGKIAFIYPTLNTATRNVQVRLEVANPKGLLKPAMFASVQIRDERHRKVLTVPTSAVIDSGMRQVVLVQLAQGNFEPRAVRLGKRGEQYVEVLEGISEGDQVVTSANFLIDAESNLKAALGGMSPSPAPAIEPAVKQEHASVVKKKSTNVGHQAQGTLDGINADGSVSISHQPIEALGWPAMTMDFELANASLAQGIPPGSAISFEIVERQPGEWIITRLEIVKHEGH